MGRNCGRQEDSNMNSELPELYADMLRYNCKIMYYQRNGNEISFITYMSSPVFENLVKIYTWDAIKDQTRWRKYVLIP